MENHHFQQVNPGKPSISMGQLYHGKLLNSQKAMEQSSINEDFPLLCLMTRGHPIIPLQAQLSGLKLL
jgi:hypothetical protein